MTLYEELMVNKYRWLVLHELDVIGAHVYEKATKKRFYCGDGLWREIPIRPDGETRPFGHFNAENCIVTGHQCVDVWIYYIPTPTQEQYEALLAAQTSSGHDRTDLSPET